MDRYQRVEKPRPERPISENEIRITSQGVIRNYISYATTLLMEKRVKEIVLKAMGQAISKTVAITEILKKRNPNLHQDIAISSLSITDVWEPIEEGLVSVEQTRHVSMISITLSTRELNTNSPGYQAPSVVEQPKRQYHYQQQQQPRLTRSPYNVANEDSYGQGRGRGRGRGRNWGRGGYGNHQENYQDNGGYTNWSPGGGRGRVWGNRGGGYERGRGGGGGGGYERGRGGGGGGGYERGRGGGGGSGYERGRGGGEGYERGSGEGGGYERGRGGRWGGGYERGGGGGSGYERGRGGGDGYERGGGEGGGYERSGGRGGGYERGRGGGGGRGYVRGRGRMGGRSREGGYQAY